MNHKKLYRADLFRHLDGLVTVPTAYSLYKNGICDLVLKEGRIELSKLSKETKANQGYLNVALRTLASQGFIAYNVSEDQIEVSTNERTVDAFALFPLYQESVRLLQISGEYHPRKFEKEPFSYLEKVFSKYKKEREAIKLEKLKESSLRYQIVKHIEGIIVGPTAVSLGMSGMFHKYFMEASFRPEEFHSDGESFGRLLDMFVYLDWFEKNNETYKFTDRGLFFAKRASAYGVTVSYIPSFRKLDELIFGDPNILWKIPEGAKEKHVDRVMNVWGSGGAHTAYFKKIDEIIIDLFNQPIELQPKGIVDIGCGNGAFLIHLFEVIESRTLRGTMLEEHPLFLVGADFNKAALKVTRANIIQAGIWAKIIWGDIGRPDLLADHLDENYGIELGDLLNVRTFLDHNRIWEEPSGKSIVRKSTSSGAYAYRGKMLSNAEVEENLKEHFLKWVPYVSKYGLLVIELHTIPPSVTSENLGRTAATAYDATHGYSDQYIVEIEVFNKIVKESGLQPVERHFLKFPNSELATVSINLLKA